MKRKGYIVVAILIVTAGIVLKSAPRQKSSTEIAGRGNPPLSLEKKIGTKEATERNVVLKPGKTQEIEIPELTEAKAEFRENLKAFRKATREYNRKAIRNELTKEDEVNYQKALAGSLDSLRLYEMAINETHNRKKNQ